MANGEVTSTDPRLFDALRRFGYGVVIQAVNGIPRLERRQTQKTQIREVTGLVRRAVGDSVRIESGLALMSREVPLFDELDYAFEIEKYNPSVLVNAAKRTLDRNVLTGLDRDLLRDMVRVAEDEGVYHLNNLVTSGHLGGSTKKGRYRVRQKDRGVSDSKRLLKVPLAHFPFRIARVKGPLLESYVAELLERKFEGQPYDIFLGQELGYGERGAIADVVIATEPLIFEEGLRRLKRSNSGKNKVVKVSYPSREVKRPQRREDKSSPIYVGKHGAR